MSIMERIRAHGGEVIRNEWRLTIRRGRLTDEALAWLRDRKDDLTREVAAAGADPADDALVSAALVAWESLIH